MYSSLLRVHLLILFLFKLILLNGQCNIPNSLLELGVPDLKLLNRLRIYERDSLDMNHDEVCLLRFYNGLIYCHRTNEEQHRTIKLADSIFFVFGRSNTFYKEIIFLEKIIAKTELGIDKEVHLFIDTLENDLRENDFYADHKNKSELLDFISQSASVFSNVERYGFVNELLKKQLDLIEEEDSFSIFQNHFLMGLNNRNNNSYHNAYDDLSRAENFIKTKSINDKVRAELVVVKGLTLIRLDSLKEAINYFHRALSLDGDRPSVMAYSMLGLGECFNKLNMRDSLKSIYPILMQMGQDSLVSKDLKRDIYYFSAVDNLNSKDQKKLRYNTEKVLENIDTSFLHDKYLYYQLKLHNAVLNNFSSEEFRDYLLYREALFERRKNASLSSSNSLLLKYQTEKEEQKNVILRAQEELQQLTILQQEKQLWVSLLGLFGVTVFSSYIYNLSRQKNRLNKKLELSNEKIELLLVDQHHRISNNISLISWFLETQGDVLEDYDAKQIVLECQNRINAMGAIHAKFTHSSQNKGIVNAEAYFIEIMKYLNESIGKTNNIVFNAELSAMQLNTDDALHLGLIVNELATNAVKHNQDFKGELAIDMSLREDNGLELILRNNGKELSDDFDIKNVESIGLGFVYKLSQQLKGQLTYFNDNGVVFKLKVPLKLAN